MNGCQLAGLTALTVSAMNSSTTATLIITMTLLKFADSLMPITRRVVTRAMMRIAGRLKVAAIHGPPSVRAEQSGAAWAEPVTTETQVPRAAESAAGIWMPRFLPRKLTTYPDQPMATVVADSAYSRIRSQPMIQAKNSPSVP